MCSPGHCVESSPGLDPHPQSSLGLLYKPSLVHHMNSGVGEDCPFCGLRETVFHCFWECVRLTQLFQLLGAVFRSVGQVFHAQVFVCGLMYSVRSRRRGQLLSFLIGQAKMVVYMSRRRRLQTQSWSV
ncbi:hypothetical protein NL108_007552 [Boleophthalmus pectinirostris]|nr:hypothetical protein NL108_007552 [Boleophthalmus pectinirostris]